jgi:hypothetical protein
VTVPYASADELAEHLTLPSTEASSNDVLLGRAVNSATLWINRRTNRRFDAVAAVARTFRADNLYRLKVDDISSLSGLVVKTDAGNDGTFETTLSIGSDFYAEPENALAALEPVNVLARVNGVWPVYCWPGRRNPIEVTAAWGWPEVPADIVEATLLYAARLYKRKNTPDGISGANDFGVLRVTRGDSDVEALIAPYIRYGALVA